MTFTGTIGRHQRAPLAGLSYAPTANYNGAGHAADLTNDLGNTGAGGALTDTDTVAITVNAVNDAPVNTVPGGAEHQRRHRLVFSAGNGNLISIARRGRGRGHGAESR